MSRFFEQDLEQIRSHLLRMGQKAVESVRLAMRALVEAEPKLKKTVYANDDEIDELENLVDSEATRLLSTCAPVAADLRFIVTTMKVSHELERVGDEAKAIARRAKRALAHDYHNIPRMAELGLQMLEDALAVFVEFDQAKAEAIWTQDLEVDKLNKENHKHFTALVSENPTLAPAIFEMVFISKSLERIGDHAVGISKEIVFMATSREVRHAEEYKKSTLKKKLAAAESEGGS